MTLRKARSKPPARRKTSRPRSSEATGQRPPIDIARLEPFWNSAGPGYFAYRLILTAKLFDNLLLRSMANAVPLSPPQIRVISQLGLLGTGTVRSLAEGAFVDRAEVSRATRELQALRLIRRLRGGTDARSALFSLSARGKRLYADFGQHVRRVLGSTLEGIGERDLALVDRTHWHVASHCLQTTNPDCGLGRGSP